MEAALRALAHPARRAMLELVWGRERTSSELAERVGISRPRASQHLRVLRASGLVRVRGDANRRLYRVDAERMAELRTSLEGFWAGHLDALRAGAEAEHRRRERGDEHA